MKITLLPPLVALLITATLASAAQPEGWVPLWNGKDLSDFHHFNGTAKYWIEDGAIVGQTREGSPNSFLCTRKRYGNFELKFEVLVNDSLNSGVQIRSQLKPDLEGDYGRVYGPQVEIESGPGQAGFIYGEATGRGWISEEPRDRSYQHDVFKNNTWNAYHIIAKGPNIKVYINGELVEDLIDEAIYETHPEGFIGLQVHSIQRGKGPYEVRWRNLMIKPLDS